MTVYDNDTHAIVPMDEGSFFPATDVLDQQASLSAFSTFLEVYGNQAKVMSQMQIEQRTDLSTQAKRALIGKYESGPVEDVSKHLRRVLTIEGSIVKYHGPYYGKTDGKAHPGYFYMLLATNIIREIEVPVAKQLVTFKRNLLIKVSATQIVEYFLSIMQADRWYDFTEPVLCFFDGTQSTGYTVSPLSEEEATVVQEILLKGK